MNNAIKNLMNGILTRTDMLVNYEEAKKQERQDKSRKNKLFLPIKKGGFFIITTLISFSLIIPTTFKINSILSSKNSSTEFQIDNLKISSPSKFMTGGDGEHPEQNYSFSMVLDGSINLLSGQIKKSYLVYTEFEDENFSEKDFHPISLNVESTSNWTYLLKSIPYTRKFEKLPLSKNIFNPYIYYYSSSPHSIKPIYILTIGSKNDISINLINIDAYSQASSKRSSPKSNSATMQFNPSVPSGTLKFFTPEKILDEQDSQNLSNSKISTESFKKDTTQIIKIARQYFTTQNIY